VLLDSAPVLWEPLTALVPDQDPDAVQAVALVAVHVTVELPPAATLAGFALNDIVGAAELAGEEFDCTDCPAEELRTADPHADSAKAAKQTQAGSRRKNIVTQLLMTSNGGGKILKSF
jgi:hypothetical protein